MYGLVVFIMAAAMVGVGLMTHQYVMIPVVTVKTGTLMNLELAEMSKVHYHINLFLGMRRSNGKFHDFH